MTTANTTFGTDNTLPEGNSKNSTLPTERTGDVLPLLSPWELQSDCPLPAALQSVAIETLNRVAELLDSTSEQGRANQHVLQNIVDHWQTAADAYIDNAAVQKETAVEVVPKESAPKEAVSHHGAPNDAVSNGGASNSNVSNNNVSNDNVLNNNAIGAENNPQANGCPFHQAQNAHANPPVDEAPLPSDKKLNRRKTEDIAVYDDYFAITHIDHAIPGVAMINSLLITMQRFYGLLMIEFEALQTANEPVLNNSSLKESPLNDAIADQLAGFKHHAHLLARVLHLESPT